MYTFNDDYCFSDKIGTLGINREAMSIFESKIKEIFNIYSKTSANTKFYKILFNFNKEELLSPLRDTAKHIRENFDDVIFIGMGGATLNTQMVLSLRKNNTKPRIHYLLTTDPARFHNLVQSIDPKKTAVVVTSKSGGTTETIAGFSALLNVYRSKSITDIKKHFYFILGELENPLRTMAEKLECKVMPHDEGIGGRFSGFSSIGFFPGLVGGLDMEKLIDGFNIVSEDLWKNRIDSAPIRAALSLMLSRQPTTILLGYLDSFSPFLEWYAQIIAESLGKEGKGITPIRGVGPMDQHSMLQLYLDGPKDKIYTMLYANNVDGDHKLTDDVIPSYLAGKSMAEINAAEFQATTTALINNNVPVRTIMIDRFDEFNLGALMMHCAIEVITVGHMMNINPFDQPGVEQIKVEARKILSA
jgi:glucose-6-phosphate isomerase